MRDPWITVWKSCEKAVTILRARGVDTPPLSEDNMPANWQELKRLHEEVWRRVYAKVGGSVRRR